MTIDSTRARTGSPFGVGTGESLPRSYRSARAETSGSTIGLVALLVSLVDLGLLAYGFVRDDLSVFSLGAVLASLPVVALAIGRFTARRPPYDLASIMWCGFFLRLFGAYFRMLGAADALLYHRYGRLQADVFRALDFQIVTDRAIPGTGGLDVISGVAHTVVFDDFYGAFVVFTVISFLGACLFLRAFQIAFPSGDEKRYALLVFLMPSLVYWPSSLGKEAWVIFGLGLSALGAANLYVRKTMRGLALAVLGVAAMALIRPHVALLAVAAIAVGALGSGRVLSRDSSAPDAAPSITQPRRAQRTSRLTVLVRRISIGSRVVAVALLVVGASWLSRYTADVLKVESLGTREASTAFDYVEQQTSQGGSEYTAARVNNPLDYPWALVTVLLRPFPGEARDLPGLLASAETMFLLGLMVVSWRRLARLPSLLLRANYVLFAAAFAAMFVYAFSSIGNFGLLARQRTQVLPFLFVLFAVPALVTRPSRGRGPAWRARRRDTDAIEHSVDADAGDDGYAGDAVNPPRARDRSLERSR